MPTAVISRPAPTEHNPYYSKYIELVPDGDIVDILEDQSDQTLMLLSTIGDTKAAYRYAPGKWSIKQTVGHVSDGERVFSYRALRFARLDATPLPGFDENTYVPAGNFDARTLSSLAEELHDVRRATLHLFRNLDAEASARSGPANNDSISVRALAYIIAGHELHHVRLLHDKYGV